MSKLSIADINKLEDEDNIETYEKFKKKHPPGKKKNKNLTKLKKED